MNTLKFKMMKKRNVILVATVLLGIFISSCTKDKTKIEGSGKIISTTLQVNDFNAFDIEGVDDVYVNYGPVQKVTVTGHSNIISKIQTKVSNKTWKIALEEGNYGIYELTYYITLPKLSEVKIEGTNKVVINDFIDQDYFSLEIVGAGNFDGVPMSIQHFNVDLLGAGNCKLTAESTLDVEIDGSGNVYYGGSPVIDSEISGTGQVLPL